MVSANTVGAGVPSAVNPMACAGPRTIVNTHRRSKIDSRTAKSSRSGAVKASVVRSENSRLAIDFGVHEADAEGGGWRKLARLFVFGSKDEDDGLVLDEEMPFIDFPASPVSTSSMYQSHVADRLAMEEIGSSY